MAFSKLTAVAALIITALLGAPAMAQETPKVPVFAEGRTLGDAKAPVTMQAYLSFGCPHCIDWWAKEARLSVRSMNGEAVRQLTIPLADLRPNSPGEK